MNITLKVPQLSLHSYTNNKLRKEPTTTTANVFVQAPFLCALCKGKMYAYSFKRCNVNYRGSPLNKLGFVVVCCDVYNYGMYTKRTC